MIIKRIKRYLFFLFESIKLNNHKLFLFSSFISFYEFIFLSLVWIKCPQNEQHIFSFNSIQTCLNSLSFQNWSWTSICLTRFDLAYLKHNREKTSNNLCKRRNHFQDKFLYQDSVFKKTVNANIIIKDLDYCMITPIQ